MNTSPTEKKISIDIHTLGWENGKEVVDLLDRKRTYKIEGQKIEIIIPGWGGSWLG